MKLSLVIILSLVVASLAFDVELMNKKRQATCTSNTCEGCSQQSCTWCVRSIGAPACAFNAADCTTTFSGIPASSCVNFTTCTSSPSASHCLIPNTATMLKTGFAACNATNQKPVPPIPTPGLTCDTAFYQDYPGCIDALRNYNCTNDCGACPNLVTFNPGSPPKPCVSLCAAINASCPNVLRAGCISLANYPCSNRTDCYAQVSADTSPPLTTAVPTTAVPTTAVASTAVPTTAVASTAVATTARATTAVVTTAVPVSTTAVQATTAVPTTATSTGTVATGTAATTAARVNPTSGVPPADGSGAASIIVNLFALLFASLFL